MQETANATNPMQPEIAQLMDRYKKIREDIALKFEQELKELVAGQPLSRDNPEETAAGEDLGTCSSSSDSNSDETDEAEDSSDDEDSKIPLPSPANPDKPATAASLAKREKLGMRSEASKLKSKKSKSKPKSKSKSKSKKKRGKESKKNMDKKQEANGMSPSTYTSMMRFLPPGVTNGTSPDSEKKERIRASKMEFKRLDELYVSRSYFLY